MQAHSNDDLSRNFTRKHIILITVPGGSRFVSFELVTHLLLVKGKKLLSMKTRISMVNNKSQHLFNNIERIYCIFIYFKFKC